MQRTTRINYSQCLVLASPKPAYQSNETNLTGLKRIQSASVDFAFSRQRYKQIGSADFVGDINLTNPEITLGLNYLYSNGTNELMLGLNVDGAAGVLSGIRRPNQSNNFYLLVSTGLNNQPLTELSNTDFKDNYNVYSFGNCFLNTYSVKGGVGNLVSVDAEIQADNMQLVEYTTGYDIPALNPSTNLPDKTHAYKIETGFFKNTTNQDGLIPSAFAPSGVKLTLPSNNNVPGLELTGVNQRSAFINSFDLSFSIERIALYGFGSIYPYGRRALLPVLGQLQFSALASEFASGDLNQLVRLDENKEVSQDFTIDLLHSGSTGLQINIDNAKFDAQSFSPSIGNNAEITCNLSFSVSDTTGLRFSTPPLILQQPDSGPTMEVVATGMSPLTYQWYNSSGPALVSDATGPTFSPSSDGDYYCVIENDLGSATTNNQYVDVP